MVGDRGEGGQVGQKRQFQHDVIIESSRTKLQLMLKLTILPFWIKFTQKLYYQSKIGKVNITIEFCIFISDQVPNFGIRTTAPRKIAPWLGLGFGLGLVLELGGGQFSSRAIVLEPRNFRNQKLETRNFTLNKEQNLKFSFKDFC